MKFNLGDRVICTRSSGTLSQKVGTVLTLPNYEQYPESDFSHLGIGIDFDENVNGHTLSGLCEGGHGQWIYGRDLRLIAPKITHICGLVCNCDAREAITF